MNDGLSLGLWLHVASLIVFAGAIVAMVAFVLPAAAQTETAVARRAFLVAALRIFDPLLIAALGVLVMSGAINLTNYKDALRGQFFVKMGWLLVWKLALAFLVIMLGTYITFGLGHRIVRNLALDDPVDPAWLDSMSKRLAVACVLSLIVIAATTWLGLALGHPSIAPPTATAG